MTGSTERMIILGATGSIGTQALDVIARYPERFSVTGLAAGGGRLGALAEQMARFQPAMVAVPEAAHAEELRQQVPDFRGEILSGTNALVRLAGWDGYNTAVIAVVGMVGLAPTLTALSQGRRVLTANKETFVAGGHLVAPFLRERPDGLLPLDSEHSAVHQCLRGEQARSVRALWLTASGGPFRDFHPNDLARVTRAEALCHPNWSMGPKITIDSATMMNKGLEIIEAHWLFNMPYEQIRVVVHPQSIIHSAVSFCDGSMLAQLGPADMRLPILYALGYPERLANHFSGEPLDLAALGALDFRKPDERLYPCLALAREAGAMGASATTVLNAADEAAVALFLRDAIRFVDIPRLIEAALQAHRSQGLCASPSLEEILQLDTEARRIVQQAACPASLLRA